MPNVFMFPCRTSLKFRWLTIDNGDYITQLMFYLTTMEPSILLRCANMAHDAFLLMGWKSLEEPTTLMTVSLSDFLQPQKILLSKLTSWDLSLDRHVEGRLLQPEGTSLPLMSPRHDRTYQPFGRSLLPSQWCFYFLVPFFS